MDFYCVFEDFFDYSITIETIIALIAVFFCKLMRSVAKFFIYYLATSQADLSLHNF